MRKTRTNRMSEAVWSLRSLSVQPVSANSSVMVNLDDDETTESLDMDITTINVLDSLPDPILTAQHDLTPLPLSQDQFSTLNIIQQNHIQELQSQGWTVVNMVFSQQELSLARQDILTMAQQDLLLPDPMLPPASARPSLSDVNGMEEPAKQSVLCTSFQANQPPLHATSVTHLVQGLNTTLRKEMNLVYGLSAMSDIIIKMIPTSYTKDAPYNLHRVGTPSNAVQVQAQGINLVLSLMDETEAKKHGVAATSFQVILHSTLASTPDAHVSLASSQALLFLPHRFHVSFSAEDSSLDPHVVLSTCFCAA